MKEKIVENVEREYKKYDELICSKLRLTDDGEFWVAKHKDPCPDCDLETCHNYGQKFDKSKSLIILKEVNNMKVKSKQKFVDVVECEWCGHFAPDGCFIGRESEVFFEKHVICEDCYEQLEKINNEDD